MKKLGDAAFLRHRKPWFSQRFGCDTHDLSIPGMTNINLFPFHKIAGITRDGIHRKDTSPLKRADLTQVFSGMSRFKSLPGE